MKLAMDISTYLHIYIKYYCDGSIHFNKIPLFL